MLNKCMFIGNLGKDPEVRYTPDGTAVANFSIATSEKWTDKNSGEKREKTEWINIVSWRRLAEICGQYLKKGSRVYVEGKMQTRSWQADDDTTRYKTEVVISEMKMLSSKSEQGGGGGYGDPPPDRGGPAQQGAPTGDGAPGAKQYPGQGGDDDIPF